MSGFICEERLAYGPWAAIERMVARLLQHAGFEDVNLVGGSGDQGADVVGTINGESWVFQAKYRASGRVDSAAIKEAIKAANVYGATTCVAVTNQTFNPEAFTYQEKMQKDGINIFLWDGDYLLDIFENLDNVSFANRELHEYQKKAVDCVESARSKGEKKSHVIMATGLGKSIVATELILKELERNPTQEILVLAHMNGLVRQLEISSWPQLDKQISTHLWTDGEVPTYQGGVVFATWQSVMPALKRGEPILERFGLVIVDEAHHAPSHQYRSLLEKLRPNFLVGLTATPWRGDELNLSDVFGPPAFTMDIVDGMQQGYLSEVDYQLLADGIDWDAVAARSKEGLTVRDLNSLLILPERDIAMVDLVAQEMEKIDKPKALAFCRSIDHAESLRPLFSQRGIKAALIHSDLPREQRFRNLSSFRTGSIDLLLSIEMLNEGIDVPDVNLIAFMRVTHSRRIFVQQLGRGLRLSPHKKKVIVLDFVADIRRIAAAINLNNDARERRKNKEVIRYHDGIINFGDVGSNNFFKEYLADVADIENYEDGSTLKFPDTH